MKINRLLFILPRLTGGGAERVTSVFCNTLSENGYDIHLILYERGKDEYPCSDKVKVHVLPQRQNNELRAIYILQKFLYLRKLIKSISPDCIIPMLPYQVEHCFLATVGLHYPMVITVRNDPLHDTPNERMRKRRDWIAKHVYGVFVQTESQKKYFPLEVQKKTFIVPNPVNQEALTYISEEKKEILHFVAAGRLEKQKNYEMMISAFEMAYQNNKGIRLDIYGSGTLYDSLMTLIQEKSLIGIVRLCGRVVDIISIMSKYDAFLMSSNYEGMPNSLMEAMGLGLPCVSTDCCAGSSELIGDNKRGILVGVDDVKSMTMAIESLCKNPKYAFSLGREARKYMKMNYADIKISKRLIEELENLQIHGR